MNDGTWEYIDGIVYHNGSVAFISTEEGRAVPNGGGNYVYQYNLKDHLGNDRVSFYSNSGTATVLQEDEYYSFGLRHGLYDASNNNRYLYNGKEIQTDLANQYDYGARFYDPVIGRWTSVDPLVEAGQEFGSPYGYVFDDPVKNTDPDGREPQGPCPQCATLNIAFLKGFADDIKAGLHSLDYAGRHPFETAGNILHALTNDPKTHRTRLEGAIKNSVAANYNKFADGDLVTKATVLGIVSGEGVQLLGGEAADFTKIGEGSNILKNAAQGKEFVAIVTQGLEDAGHINIAEQVSIKPNGETGRVRLDNISTKDGKIALTDAKSSSTAGYTKNQKAGYPAIAKKGGTVVGNKGAAQGYPAGTIIPPTKVDIVRPK
ncbi:RHS repeat-associated core domain-containing protein [Mucilaginibacter mali]|uniref:RHS repeat-associated core domain-containing protein n=1 Tax=Mucilaginibacter mali TaxID=2740462 RepID=A0A7D4Q168_9SPHI|nr:RHS repeat-associated core domain-containing protein [Mucilaginibacter mali]QKJ30366.1 RHS repeat-associated core domain-containing protein [Mucilaginibacter mali]